MAMIEGEIYIDRPPEVVFDIVADERNEPLYNPKMTAVSLLSGAQIGSGSRFIATMKSRVRAFSMMIEFTDFERPTILGSVSTVDTMRTVGALNFKPKGSGTVMTWSWDIGLRGIMKLAAPIVSWMGRGQERAIWTGLKTMLEADVSNGKSDWRKLTGPLVRHRDIRHR
jgi:polyketide cyclase/dehydrase/lipid transport protein